MRRWVGLELCCDSNCCDSLVSALSEMYSCLKINDVGVICITSRKNQHNKQEVIIVITCRLPREGHFDAAIHVMVHIGISRLVYDPSYPGIDHSVFKKCD